MLDQDALRMAEVFRLHLAGLTAEEIAAQLCDDTHTVGVQLVELDLAQIEAWQRQYTDPEQMRLSITLDLDALFKSLIAEMGGQWLSKHAYAKAEYYKQAREILLQKALLYGLNTQNVNVNRSKLWTIIEQIRDDATQLEAETNHPALAEPDGLSLAVAPAPGLLVESDSGYGR